MKKIGIVIVNYNGEKDTKELLTNLSKINIGNFKISVYIVNNSFRRDRSDDLSYGEDQKTLPYEIKIINNEHNRGFAAANNQGIKLALEKGADYVCLLNNDTTVDFSFLQNLFDFFEKNEKVGISSPKIYFSKNHEFHKDRYKEDERGKVIWYAGGIIDWKNVYCSHKGVDEIDNGQYDTAIDTDFATGCCIFIRREVIEKIGNLNEKYFAYFEDVDFCVRARKIGYEIKYIPQSVVWHKNASSSGGAGSSLQFFLQERNRLYFGFKYASFKVKLHLIKLMVKFLFTKNYKISLSLLKMFL